MPKAIIIMLLASMLFFSFLACKNMDASSKGSVVKEFEGVITYREIERDSDSRFDVDDTVQLFYSHGNYIGIHTTTSAGFHPIKDYYLENKPLRLFLFNNSDSLYQLKLSNPLEKLDSFSVRKIKDKIFSRRCEEIDLNAHYNEKDSTTYTDFKFVFSPGYLPVDKEHFKNWNLGFFNKVVNQSGAFYLKFKIVHFDSSHKKILSHKTYDVISVKEQAIDPKIFDVDTTKINWRR